MSEVGIPGSMEEATGGVEEVTLTAGRMMRSAREAAGLHVAALAVSMKIPVKKLEALEADRLDLLHDAVFVRALAASVCRALKIDPAPVLSKLPLNIVPRLTSVERGINTPFRTSGELTGSAVSTLISKPQVLLVAALLVGVMVVAFFPEIKVSESAVETPSPAVKSDVAAAPAQIFSPPVEAVASSPAQPVAVAVTRTKTISESQSALVGPAPVTAPVVLTARAASEPVRSASVAASATSGLVVFKARGASWVKVVDAKGVVQLSKTLVDGEVVAASGETPLSVVVGRVDATDVEVRGKVFSLVEVAKDNVARFEVK